MKRILSLVLCLTLDLIITEVKEALPDSKIMLMEPFVMEGRATQSTEAEPDRWANFHSEVLLQQNGLL